MNIKAKRKKTKKNIIIVSVLLAVVIALALAIPTIVSADDKKTEVTSGETKTVTVGTQDIKQVVSGSGQIVTGDEEVLEVDEDEEVDEVLVEEGQAVKKGEVLLEYDDGTEMTAPFKGVIGTVSVTDSDDDSSMNSTATESITIKSTETLVTELSVDETDLADIKVGQKAEVTVNALPDTEFTGTVTKISETGEYDNGSSKFNIVVKLDKTASVKIGMSADVVINVKSVEGVVAVPIEAVKGSGENASVMVVNSDGTASSVSVELGLANDAYVQIVSGLSEDDTIQYTVASSSSSTSGSGFGSGTMLGNGGDMPSRDSNSGSVPGGSMSQSN
jgi:multidrug efflux pump subunit AcrA (membrane-fusion protein)